MEHRMGQRLPTHESISLRIGDAQSVSAVMTDMSVSGAFVRSERQPGLLSTVWVGLQKGVGDRRSKSVVSAQVVRQSPDGFGIEWADFAPPAVCMRLNRHWLRESLDQLQRPYTGPATSNQ
jgi:PilZ domain